MCLLSPLTQTYHQSSSDFKEVDGLCASGNEPLSGYRWKFCGPESQQESKIFGAIPTLF